MLDDDKIKPVLERILAFVLTDQKLFKQELGKRAN